MKTPNRNRTCSWLLSEFWPLDDLQEAHEDMLAAIYSNKDKHVLETDVCYIVYIYAWWEEYNDISSCAYHNTDTKMIYYELAGGQKYQSDWDFSGDGIPFIWSGIPYMDWCALNQKPNAHSMSIIACSVESIQCRPRVSNIFFVGRKLECIARLTFFLHILMNGTRLSLFVEDRYLI